jgi:hypothetical protein
MRRLLFLIMLAGCGGPESAAAVADAASGTGVDAASDATEDGPVLTDAQADARAPVAEAGPVADGGLSSCTPGDVSGFSTSWHPPTAPQSRCTDAELDQLVASCFAGTSTQTACSAFRLASPLCWSCVVTYESDPTWGPIVVLSPMMGTYGNFPGCLAMETGDESATGCAAKAQAEEVCAEVACSGPNCPDRTTADSNAINGCEVESVLDGGCAPYGAPADDCVSALLADGGQGATAVHLCRFDTYGDYVTYFRALGGIFCGLRGDGGLGDGASDAGISD